MTPLHRAWTDGVIAALREYSWWRDDVQCVGRTGSVNCTTLQKAIDRAESVWADEADDQGIVEVMGKRWTFKNGGWEELT